MSRVRPPIPGIMFDPRSMAWFLGALLFAPRSKNHSSQRTGSSGGELYSSGGREVVSWELGLLPLRTINSVSKSMEYGTGYHLAPVPISLNFKIKKAAQTPPLYKAQQNMY